MKFKLDPILERDSFFVKNLELCQVRLINNKDFPWILLVPMQGKLVEITDLSVQDYAKMNDEIRVAATFLKKYTRADKLNIATIGNIVSQLHVHLIVRYKDDKLFPNPVWGCKFTKYTNEELQEFILELQKI